MDEADKLCDRIAIVDHGELKALDSPLKLKASIPGKNIARGQLLGRAGRAGTSALERLPGRRVRSPAHDHIFRIATAQRPGDDAGADGAGGAARRHRAVAVGPEHDARRRVRALHRAGRCATRCRNRRPQDSPFMLQARRDMHRTWAIIERELRRFRRSPMLIVMSMIMPLVQLVVLGYAFGGNVKHLKLAIVDQDHGVPAVQVRELASAAASGAHTFDIVDYADQGAGARRPAQRPRQRRADDPAGLLAPRAGEERAARRADRGQHRQLRLGRAGRHAGRHAAGLQPAGARRRASPAQPTLDVVEVYPYVPYVQYLLPGSIVMSIFMMVMIGGGIIFIDDKARGLHEGYLVTPITKLELIAGFNISGTIKAVLAGHVPDDHRLAHRRHSRTPLDPLRLLRLFVVIVRDGVRADQPDVPADGAGQRSAAAARDLRRAEHACCISRAAPSIRSRAFRAGCR